MDGHAVALLLLAFAFIIALADANFGEQEGSYIKLADAAKPPSSVSGSALSARERRVDNYFGHPACADIGNPAFFWCCNTYV